MRAWFWPQCSLQPNFLTDSLRIIEFGIATATGWFPWTQNLHITVKYYTSDEAQSWGIFNVLYAVKANLVGQKDSGPIGLGLSLIFTTALPECFRAFLDMSLMNYKMNYIILLSLCWWNFCLYLSLKRDHNTVSSHAWIHLWNYLTVSVQGCKPMFCILFNFSMYFLSWQYQWLEFLQKEDKCSSKDTSMPYSLNLQKYRNDRIYT